MPDSQIVSENPSAASAWYVVQAKANHEMLVAAKLAERSLPVFLPRIVATVRAGRSLQRRVVPMFPTYLFVEANLAELGPTIRYTQGVRDFLRFGGFPEAVAPEILEILRARTGPTGVFEPAPRTFTPGERLRIQDGPFRDLEVIFERELDGAGRVAVLLSQMQLAARVVLDRRQLSAA